MLREGLGFGRERRRRRGEAQEAGQACVGVVALGGCDAGWVSSVASGGAVSCASRRLQGRVGEKRTLLEGLEFPHAVNRLSESDLDGKVDLVALAVGQPADALPRCEALGRVELARGLVVRVGVRADDEPRSR